MKASNFAGLPYFTRIFCLLSIKAVSNPVSPDIYLMKNALLTLAGAVALLLGIIGIALPGLPTTPFVLLAAYCFAQASPKLHRWLKQNRLFGKMISDWEATHSLSRKTKLLASTVMMVMVSFSIWQLSGQPLLQIAIFGLGLIGSLVVWKIPDKIDSP